jgi:hypothetical protein
LIFLRANVDVFTWKPSEMLGVPREVIEHTLEVRANTRPVKQKPWRQPMEQKNFICEEINKLL